MQSPSLNLLDYAESSQFQNAADVSWKHGKWRCSFMKLVVKWMLCTREQTWQGRNAWTDPQSSRHCASWQRSAISCQPCPWTCSHPRDHSCQWAGDRCWDPQPEWRPCRQPDRPPCGIAAPVQPEKTKKQSVSRGQVEWWLGSHDYHLLSVLVSQHRVRPREAEHMSKRRLEWTMSAYDCWVIYL